MASSINHNSKPINVLECIRDCQKNLPAKEFRPILNSVFRYVLPGLGMPEPQSSHHFSEDEIEARYTFLEQLPVERITEFLEISEQQLQKTNLKTNTQAQYRCQVNKLVKHAKEIGCIPKDTDIVITPYRFASERGTRIERKKLTNKGKTKEFSLSFCPQDYPNPLFVTAELTRLKTELDEIETYFRNRGWRESSIVMRIEDIKKIWGMLYRYQRNKAVRSGYEKRKRPFTAIAHSLQKFILLALFILLPPERQEIYRELRLNKNLKHGLEKENRFTPIQEMLEASQARYYIDLSHGEYKTSDTHGEWMGLVLNQKFKDGTCLYDYLNLWIYGANAQNPLQEILQLKDNRPLRSVLKPKQHDHVFLGRNKGMPMNKDTLASLIRHFFERVSGTPVTPHTLRAMFRTYIDEIGVTDEESRAIAFWMKHTSRTAQGYSRMQCSQRLKAGGELVMKINSSLIEEVSQLDFRSA